MLFGATGDLARRKLLPGLFHLAEAGLMPERFRIIGTTRRELADENPDVRLCAALAVLRIAGPDEAATREVTAKAVPVTPFGTN